VKITRKGYLEHVQLQRGAAAGGPRGMNVGSITIRIDGILEPLRLSVDGPTAEACLRSLRHGPEIVEVTFNVKDPPEYHDLDMDHSG
jgi:hypothetical protein